MTISNAIRKTETFVGTGLVSEFPFDFKVFKQENLVLVLYTISTATESNMTLTTDYTVALNPDQNQDAGGTVTLVSPLSTDQLLTITSAVEYLQPTDLTNQGGFYPTVINDALDRATMQIQQLKENVDRCVAVSISSGDDPATLVATIIAAEASASNSASAASVQAGIATDKAQEAADSAAILADGDKGDVTVSGSGTVWAINDSTIDPDKLTFNTVVQRIEGTPSTTYATDNSGSFPMDNTVPQKTEGASYVAVTITPKSATNRLIIEGVFYGGTDGANNIGVSICDTAINDCLAASVQTNPVANFIQCIKIHHELAAGSTSARTYQLRAGTAAGTLHINGISTSGALFNGKMGARLSVTEVSA